MCTKSPAGNEEPIDHLYFFSIPVSFTNSEIFAQLCSCLKKIVLAEAVFYTPELTIQLPTSCLSWGWNQEVEVFPLLRQNLWPNNWFWFAWMNNWGSALYTTLTTNWFVYIITWYRGFDGSGTERYNLWFIVRILNNFLFFEL